MSPASQWRTAVPRGRAILSLRRNSCEFMLFSCTGSSNVRNRRVVVVEQEELAELPNSSFSGRCSSLSGSVSQGTISRPNTAQSESQTTDSPAQHSRSRSSSRANSRTEILQPGRWTSVNPKVRIRTLSVSEQRQVFAVQKEQQKRSSSVGAIFTGERNIQDKLQLKISRKWRCWNSKRKKCLQCTLRFWQN